MEVLLGIGGEYAVLALIGLLLLTRRVDTPSCSLDLLLEESHARVGVGARSIILFSEIGVENRPESALGAQAVFVHQGHIENIIVFIYRNREAITQDVHGSRSTAIGGT